MRLEQLQEFIWKHFIRKPCRVQLSTVSCSPTVGNEIFQQRDTYQLPTAHLAELLRSCDEIPWAGQCSKSFLHLLDFLSLRHMYKWCSHLKFPFSLYSKSNSFLCTCRLYVHKKNPTNPQTKVHQRGTIKVHKQANRSSQSWKNKGHNETLSDTGACPARNPLAPCHKSP